MRQQDEVIEGGEAATQLRTSAAGLGRRARRWNTSSINCGTSSWVARARAAAAPIAGHLTHIAAWERMIVAHLTDGTDHDVVRMAPDEYENATLDQLNARIYSMHEHDAIGHPRRVPRRA